ncbi:MAG TPA: MFS transporter [Polyangiaceae bacterium]|nr:MFS transporter [Polyangiaceae bacterium]
MPPESSPTLPTSAPAPAAPLPGAVDAATAREPVTQGGPSKWAVYCVVAIGVLMATLDSSIVNISLPTIARAFGRPLNGALQWVVIAYLLVIVALLLSGGRLGDMLGRKRVWQTGLAVFTLGSVLCGLAPGIEALIGFRALQGVGAALLMAISPALLTSAFPPEERGRALGMNALTVAVGVSAGPPLGGIITERLSWRWIFFINLPLGVLGIVLAGWLLQRPLARGSARFDFGGALLLAVGLASFTGALSFAHDLGYRSPWIVGALVVSAVALRWLFVHERGQSAPILPLALFANPAFRSALACLVLSFVSLFGVAFLTPFYLEQLRRLSTEQSGLMMIAYPLMIALLGPFTGSLSDRIGSRVLAPIGLCLAGVALLLLGSVRQDTPLALVAACLALGGVAQALFQPANNSALLGAAPPGQQGVAGGMLATGRVLGQSLSIALAGAVFAAFGGAEAGRALGAVAAGDTPDAALIGRFLEGYRAALWVSAGTAFCGALLALGRSRPQA